MQTSHEGMATCRRWIAGAAAVLVMAAATAPAAVAQDKGPDAEFFRWILSGIGLKRADDPEIDYRERSPLVVPRDATLPPPESGALAQRYPNWPTDPEIRYARKLAEEQKKNAMIPEHERHRVLMPDELEVGRRRGRSSSPESPLAEDSAKPLSPSALGQVGNIFSKLFEKDKPESKRFTREPARTALTDPPPGYQTPSSGHSYGIGQRGPGPLPSSDPFGAAASPIPTQ